MSVNWRSSLLSSWCLSLTLLLRYLCCGFNYKTFNRHSTFLYSEMDVQEHFLSNPLPTTCFRSETPPRDQQGSQETTFHASWNTYNSSAPLRTCVQMGEWFFSWFIRFVKFLRWSMISFCPQRKFRGKLFIYSFLALFWQTTLLVMTKWKYTFLRISYAIFGFPVAFIIYWS